MPPVNDFLPFCPTDTGTNLLSESDYLAASDRTNGNQPGVASSKLVNKAIRQATYIAGQLAQYLADKTGADVLDDATPAKLLAQMNASFGYLSPKITRYTSGSGSHNITFVFKIASGNATAGATYTNNGVTYTVVTTVAAGVSLSASGNGAPTVSGTLTKTGGTGDATLTFYAVRAPLYLRVKMAGGGGGGGGSFLTSGSAGATGTAGGTTTFGTSLLTCTGGAGTQTGGAAGGAPTVNSPAIQVVASNGGAGTGGSSSPSGTGTTGGGGGGNFLFGPGGPGGASGTVGQSPVANSGCGSGGGGGIAAGVSQDGGGGGSGAAIEALIPSPGATYAYAVGAAGAGGAAGTSGLAGGTPAAGVIIVEEHYQ